MCFAQTKILFKFHITFPYQAMFLFFQVCVATQNVKIIDCSSQRKRGSRLDFTSICLLLIPNRGHLLLGIMSIFCSKRSLISLQSEASSSKEELSQMNHPSLDLMDDGHFKECAEEWISMGETSDSLA